MLKVNDTVLYRGSWGRDLPVEADVIAIQVKAGGKEYEVDEIEWEYLNDRSVVVHLDNGKWGYGFQIKPKEI